MSGSFSSRYVRPVRRTQDRGLSVDTPRISRTRGTAGSLTRDVAQNGLDQRERIVAAGHQGLPQDLIGGPRPRVNLLYDGHRSGDQASRGRRYGRGEGALTGGTSLSTKEEADAWLE